MPMPFQPFARNAGFVGKGAGNALHGTGQGRAAPGHAIVHCVAKANLDGHAALEGKLHQLLGKRQAKTVNIGAGNILEMAAGNNAPFQGLACQVNIHAHGLAAGFAQFEEYVIIRNAGQHAGFLEFHVADKLQIFPICPYPGSDAGKPVAARAADIDTFAVARGIKEKFRTFDQAAFSAKAVQKIKHLGHLAHSVRRPGLLTVAKCGVCNPHPCGRPWRKQNTVKTRAADAGIWEEFTVKPRFVGILQ